MDLPSGKKSDMEKRKTRRKIKRAKQFAITYKAMLLIWILCCQLLFSFQNMNNNLIQKITVMVEEIWHINSTM